VKLSLVGKYNIGVLHIRSQVQHRTAIPSVGLA